MTRDSVSDVPNQPATPQRSVRMSDETWEQIKTSAAAQGMSASELVREVVEAYLREGEQA
ncbi:MAG: CopG family transcriptional regulator [Rhodoglobus sp.]